MAGFDSIFTEVKARIGNRSGIDSRITQWVNDSYFELMLLPRFVFHELEKTSTIVTVVNTASYSLPTDLWFILNVTDTTNGREIRKGSWRSFDRRPATSGQVARYDRFGSGIQLDPPPNAIITMTVRYRFRPTELTAGGSHLLGREWDEVIIVLATVKAFEALEQQQQAAVQRQLLEGLMGIRLSVRELEDTEQELNIQPRLL